MKKNKKSLLVRYRKEALVLMMGSSLVIVLILNLQKPHTKRVTASQNEPPINQEAVETQQAASKVEDEQTLQSIQLLKFKKDYANFTATKKCLISQDCPYPDNDPREYSLSVSKDLSLKLKTLKPQLVSNWFRLNEKVRNEITASITVEDGFVKEQVLELLLSLTPEESSPYLPLVLKHVIEHHNSELIPKAFEYLKRASTPENEIKIAKRVAQAIVTGSPHTAQAMSRNIARIISPSTSEIYKEAISNLPKRALETEFLTSALLEFELIQSGG